MKRVLIAAALLAAPLATAAQTSGGPADPPTFRAGAELVALAVTVVDEGRSHVSGLTVSDFVVLEDGVEQPLSYFAASATPIDVTLLVDASASMGDKMAVVRDAVRGLTRSLREDDRAAIVEFRETTTERQAMTGDRAAIEAALDRVSPSGGTALYTALYVALSELRSAARSDRLRRQAIVVLSDGEDTTSLVGSEDVLERARRSGVAVYAIALHTPTSKHGTMRPHGGGAPITRGEHALRRLAQETGGVAFFPSALRDLTGVYGVIAEELGRQYMIGYTPSGGAGEDAWRAVRVRLPSHPRARIRTRSGYYADDSPAFAVSRLRHDRP